MQFNLKSQYPSALTVGHIKATEKLARLDRLQGAYWLPASNQAFKYANHSGRLHVCSTFISKIFRCFWHRFSCLLLWMSNKWFSRDILNVILKTFFARPFTKCEVSFVDIPPFFRQLSFYEVFFLSCEGKSSMYAPLEWICWDSLRSLVCEIKSPHCSSKVFSSGGV